MALSFHMENAHSITRVPKSDWTEGRIDGRERRRKPA
jgi:hypothetical protein